MATGRTSARLRRARRTGLGFAALGLGTSICGAAVVLGLLTLQGIPADMGGRRWILTACAGGYVLVSLMVGTAWAGFLQRRTVVWFLFGRSPTPEEATRALRIPLDLAVVSGTLWAGGVVLLGAVTALLGSWLDALGVTLALVLGGFATVCLTYLAAEWVARPVMTLALDVAPVRGNGPGTVLTRLLLTWVLGSGVPLVAVLLIVLPPYIGKADPGPSLVGIAVVGLVIGALATALLARSVAAPLHRLRGVLDRIAGGRLDVSVDIDDSGEIGMVQSSVNALARGLREQRRLRDLFGRHVGADVVRHALEHGVSLSGDVREVTALFVDVVDSTALAAELPPQELVAKLNRLFTSVVDAVNANGGLVNKFQGDAALCVFGAPAGHADPATAALSTARAIRDAVISSGELDLGIGVATGQAFAGQLGTRSRLEYTVIGDAVNEAARLTEHAKQVPSRILASEVTVERAVPSERRRWHHHTTATLRGRPVATEAWTDDAAVSGVCAT